jgi:hypothetical protein
MVSMSVRRRDVVLLFVGLVQDGLRQVSLVFVGKAADGVGKRVQEVIGDAVITVIIVLWFVRSVVGRRISLFL